MKIFLLATFYKGLSGEKQFNKGPDRKLFWFFYSCVHRNSPG